MPSYCSSSDRFLQSHYAVLLSSFILFFSCTSWCCCSFLYISQILQAQIFSFSVLSFCCTDQEFLQSPRVFFFWRLDVLMFAKDLTGCFSHCCAWGGEHRVHVCIFIVHDGERCKPPVYHSLEGFQHVGIFELSEVKLESCAFWLADPFQMMFNLNYGYKLCCAV